MSTDLPTSFQDPSQPSTEWLDALLLLTTAEERRTELLRAGYLNDSGLNLLLDEVEAIFYHAPTRAAQLAAICDEQAEAAQSPISHPRARFWQAHVYATTGDFANALELSAQARQGFEELNLRLQMLRTYTVDMRALGERGNYDDAIAISNLVLTELGPPTQPPIDSPERDELALAARILQNQGMLFERVGRYDEALTSYAAAEERYRILEDREHIAYVVENRGLIWMLLGRAREALGAFEDANQLYRTENLTLVEAESLINIGEAHLLLSNFVDSLAAFTEAERLFNQVGEHSLILLRHIGDAYLALNLYGEALDAYRRAIADLSDTLVYHHGQALWGQGMALAALGQRTEAQQSLVEAETIFVAAGNVPLRLSVMLERAQLLALAGDDVAARQLAAQALELSQLGDWKLHRLFALLRVADLALPDTQEAERHLEEARGLVDALPLPMVRYRLHQRLGRLFLLQGDPTRAQQALEQAINEIEQIRGALIQDRLRASFLDDKATVYQDLMQIHIERGDAENIQRAFEIAERAKSRSLAELLSGLVEQHVQQVSDPAMVEHIRALQAELEALYNEMLGGDGRGMRAASDPRLQARAVEVERTLSRLQLQVTLRTGPVSATSAPNGSTSPDIPFQSKSQAPTLIVYHAVNNQVVAFVRHANQVEIVHCGVLMTTLEERVQQLSMQWERFRIGRDFIDRHAQQLMRTIQHRLHELYCMVFQPVLSVLDKIAPRIAGQVRDLVIVPHAILHRMPFHALYDGNQYVIEHEAISYAPSAAIFDLCSERHLDPDGAVLLFGVHDERIPAVAEEIQQVSAMLRSNNQPVEVWLNECATSQTFMEKAAGASYLHLACHGIFRSDNPMFSGLRLHDRWLMATDIVRLRFADALVTLSACESGRSKVNNADETLGLPYAFLSAGASSLLVSQWLVEDTSSAELMRRWYTSLPHSKNLAHSLRQAQLQIMNEHPHPYYWAPFFLIGRREVG